MVGLTGRKHAPLEAGKTKDKRQKTKDKRQKNSILQSFLNHFYLLTFIFCLVTYLFNKQ